MEVLKLSSENLNEMVQKTARSIRRGQIVICPTDTVYGLICDATNQKAVKRIILLKRRSPQKPIPVFVKDIKMAKRLAEINRTQAAFLKEVWPGAVTAVLKRKNSQGTIGLRIPNHKWLLGLAEQLNRPLTGTSANISGKPASTEIKEVLEQFKNKKYQPDLVIDAGNLAKSKPSTVVDLTLWPPKILRF